MHNKWKTFDYRERAQAVVVYYVGGHDGHLKAQTIMHAPAWLVARAASSIGVATGRWQRRYTTARGQFYYAAYAKRAQKSAAKTLHRI